ncbi:DUF1574 domain-containing protein [Vibrio sonorensis]|uniref:DUF1574 domain-containing protein n=1 Tax=Vibrio sonorensis TaxID=1004316 RepID=UPI0008DA4B8F|nr:DUF1574 domain-containing protein [Vibrio sonorensis]
MWQDVKERSKQYNKTITNVIIGDSRSKAGLVPNLMGEDWYNYSVGGGTPIEGYYTLKRIIESGNELDNLILSYGPFHLTKEDTYWHRTNKFHFLSPLDYIEISNVADELDDPILGDDRSWYDYWVKPGSYFGDIKKSIFRLQINSNNNKKVSETINKSKGQYFFGRKESSSGMNQETHIKVGFKPSPLLDHYLKKAIKLAHENKIDIFWVTLPHNESSFSVIDSNFNNGFDYYIRNLSNITPLTLSHSLPDSCFGDPSHLFNCSNTFTESIYMKIKKD